MCSNEEYKKFREQNLQSLRECRKRKVNESLKESNFSQLMNEIEIVENYLAENFPVLKFKRLRAKINVTDDWIYWIINLTIKKHFYIS